MLDLMMPHPERPGCADRDAPRSAVAEDPVIILTAAGQEQQHTSAMALGALTS
jgi:DNA-binding response OmpR family regulator